MVLLDGGEEGNDDQGNKRKLPGEKDEEVIDEGPEQKKQRAEGGGGISGCAQGVLAFNEKGKKYYQCKMSGCTKVRIILVSILALYTVILLGN